MPKPQDAELFIGIVARLGVDTQRGAQVLQATLRDYGYDVIEIKVTGAITELERYKDLSPQTTEERYDKYISACNDIRAATKNNDIMAKFAISQINAGRSAEKNPNKIARRAFIINQLKRKEECELLRSVYGEHYIQLSFHANIDIRANQLAERIADDHAERPRAENWLTSAHTLMDKDEAEEDKVHGQRVRDVFPLSDVVIDASTSETIKNTLDRFFRALFGDPRVTPSKDEHGMQLANVASLRSSDLSRQVGAAILNNTAEIQALGCNEVPRAGGGTYWEGDPQDAREFQLEKDSNDERKREILLDLAGRMLEAGIIDQKYSAVGALKSVLLERADDKISNSQLMDSLEYGRTVHAEMNAITDAARNGHSIRDCTLYSNTFPCHNCAKHIVSSGIVNVVYLRPYPKSYTKQLFSDSIAVDPRADVEGKVHLRQFVGIVGPMYERVFSKSRWKTDNGKVPPFVKDGASFIRRTPIPAYDETESVICLELEELLAKAGLEPVRAKAETPITQLK